MTCSTDLLLRFAHIMDEGLKNPDGVCVTDLEELALEVRTHLYEAGAYRNEVETPEVPEPGPEFFWATQPDDHWSNGPFPSREAALQDGRERAPGKTIHTGILVLASLDSILPDGDDVIDHMRNAASDLGDEDNDWLGHISKEDTKDLGDRVQTVIRIWLDDSRENPTFGLIESIEEHLPE